MVPDSRRENDDWKEFERFIYDAFRRQGLKVHRDVRIKGRSGTRHQIDVFAEFRKAGLDFRVIIECKYLNKKVGLNIIREIDGLIDDVRAEKAVVVSRKGFTRGALRFASDKNIGLVSANDILGDVDFHLLPLNKVPMGMLENMIDPIDLLILEELNKGTAEYFIPTKITEQTKVPITRKAVVERIQSLENKGVILKRHTAVVDPIKLYNHIYMILIKVRFPLEHTVSGFHETFFKLMDINRKHGNILRLLFSFSGAGDWDFVGMAYVNDHREYYDLIRDLASKGIVERTRSSEIGVGGLYYFDPVSVPRYIDYTNLLIRIMETMPSVIKK